MCLSLIKVPAREGASNEGKLLWLACSPGDPDAQVMTLADIKRGELFDPPVTIVSDFEMSFRLP